MTTIEKIVVFIAGPLIAAGAGWLTGAAAKYGLHLDPEEVTALATAGVVAAVAFIVKWLHSHHQQFMALGEIAKEAEATWDKLPKDMREELEKLIRSEILAAQRQLLQALRASRPTPAAKDPAEK